MLDWIDNLPAITIVTHVIAAMIGGCLGVMVAALCVAARGPQYRPGKRDIGNGYSIRDIPKPNDWGCEK